MVKSKELKVAIEAAKRGAIYALKYFDKKVAVEFKHDGTPVTKIDKECEIIIEDYIRSKFSKAKFIGEERGGNIEEEEFWTIDPIDGTRDFSRGIPLWFVLVAFCRKNEPILGVCYFPLFDAFLYAEKDKGAYLNRKRVHVSQVNAINQALLAYGNPRYIKNKQALLKLIEVCGSARGWEANYGTFLLAQGKADAFIDEYGYLWDEALFKVIIEEAGGKITNLNGTPWSFNERGCLATNGLLHDEVVRITNS